ncbi:MAG: hypothetical protein HY321_17385 [Armatimonadetes bacterium]|nr:hypothetical protein [Armatimonadota bacterium]
MSVASATLERVLEQVKELSAAEQQELREFLARLAGEEAGDGPEDAFERGLLEAGILTEPKPPGVDSMVYEGRTPFRVTGKPASEIILEERR